MLHALLCLAPALALMLALLARRYPGQRLLIELRRPSLRMRFVRRAPVRVVPRRAVGHPVRCGSLLAWSLAVRPPPAAVG